jgi:hypothetical protein
MKREEQGLAILLPHILREFIKTILKQLPTVSTSGTMWPWTGFGSALRLEGFGGVGLPPLLIPDIVWSLKTENQPPSLLVKFHFGDGDPAY